MVDFNFVCVCLSIGPKQTQKDNARLSLFIFVKLHLIDTADYRVLELGFENRDGKKDEFELFSSCARNQLAECSNEFGEGGEREEEEEKKTKERTRNYSERFFFVSSIDWSSVSSAGRARRLGLLLLPSSSSSSSS